MYSINRTLGYSLWYNLYTYRHYIALCLMFIANVAIFWPGQMTGDSYNQYEAALTQNYSDANPAMMSVIWHFLNNIYQGSGLLFLMHLCFLYGAAWFFMTCVPDRYRFLIILMPLTPPISLYSSMIWKDVSFAFSYTLALAWLSYVLIKTPSSWFMQSIAVICLLMYGTAVKYQAQFILPLALLGFSCLFTNNKLKIGTLFYTLGISVLLFISLHQINNFFVPPAKKSHFWQLVKLYDLAGISIQNDQNTFPLYVQNYTSFDLTKVKKLFNYERVDDLFNTEDAPLRMAHNQAERDQILQAWYYAVFYHPWLYCKHRFLIWWRTIAIVPLERLATLDFNSYQGLKWFCTLQSHAQNAQTNDLNTLLINLICTIALFILSASRHCFRLLVWLPFLIGYFLLSARMINKSKYALPLFIMNSIGITFLGILFFCTMASTIRYVYLVFCMIHCSHAFAYCCWQDLKKLKQIS